MPRPPLALETWGKIRRFTSSNGTPSAIAYYRDSAGKRRRMLRTGKSEAAAERALVAALKVATGEDDGLLSKESTVEALSRAWFEEAKAKGLKPGSLRTYQVALDSHIIKGIGGLRLYEATVPRIDRFLKTLAATSGPGTATTSRVVLKGMFGLAVRHGAMRDNPVAATLPAKQRRSRPVAPDKAQVIGIRSRFLEWDRMGDAQGSNRAARLLDACDMLIGTGIRTGELLALKWEDIDLVAATVSIRRTVAVSEDGKAFVQDLPKTDDSERVLNLPPQVMQMLARRVRTSEFVFPSRAGTFWQPSNFRSRWREALKGTEYEGTTPRAFRKLVATTLQRALGSRAAGDQLGHASERTTEQHYIAPLRQGPATQVLEDLFAISTSEVS